MRQLKFVAATLIAAIAACQSLSAPQAGGAGQAVWLKGDLHVHDDHSSDGSLPRQRSKDRAKGNVSVADQIGQAEKQGLDFVPLTDHRTFDQYYDPQWQSSKLLLVPGEEANGAPHATVHGAADSIVQGAQRADRPAFTHIQQSIWDAHSQDASWTIAHPDDGETNDDGLPNDRASVVGVDLVEIWNKASDIEKEIAYSENRWNAGFRYGVAGASDSHFRELWDRQGPGFPTTSVLAEAKTERGVIDALRAGHTSLSIRPAGPMLTLTAEIGGAKGPTAKGVGGDELIAKAGDAGKISIRVQHAAGMDVLVYRKPGRSAGVFRTFKPTREDETFTLEITAGAQPDWYRAEVRGMGAPDPPRGSTGPAPTGQVMLLQALASPVFVSTAPVVAKGELPVPSDAGGEDGAALKLGAASAFTGFPDVSVEGGVTHIVAEAHGAGTSRIVYSNGGAQQVLSGPAPARFPKVAAKGKDVFVVWQEDAQQIPHRPQIRMRHSGDGGKSWDAVTTVRAIEGRAEHPDIAIIRSGHPVVVWQEMKPGEPFDVMVEQVGADTEPRDLSREGKVFGPGSPDDTRSARYPASVWPAIATDASGWRYAVVWQDNRTDIDPLWTGSEKAAGTNPDNWQIMYAMLDPETVTPSVYSLGADDHADRHPDVAFTPKGDLVIAWETKELSPAGRNLSVVAARSDDGGATFAAPVTLGPDAQTMSERVRLGLDASGAVRAVWYDSRSLDWRWRVMTSVMRDGAWDAGRLIDGKGNNTWPATAGGAIVFASTRNATRLQRDPTQQVFLLPAK